MRWVLATLLLLAPAARGKPSPAASEVPESAEAQPIRGDAGLAPLPLVTAGTLPAGVTAVTLFGGRPFFGLRLERGFLPWLDAGLEVGGSPHRFLRSGLGARARIFRVGCGGMAMRAQASLVQPLGGAFGSRRTARTADVEMGLQADLGLNPSCSVGLFAEMGGLLVTDFSNTRTGLFLLSVAGVEWSPLRHLSLLVRGGQLRGALGARSIFSGGVAVRF